MRHIRALHALSLGALSLIACRRAPTVALTPDSATTLSGCVVTLLATVEPSVPAGTSGKFTWFVNDEIIPNEAGDTVRISRRADEKTAMAIKVRYAKAFARAEATANISIEPVPFRDPRESGLAFSEKPVIDRGENQLVDPGAMLWDGEKFRTVYNAIAKDYEIYFGYAESDDGVTWRRMNTVSTPLLDKAAVASVVGIKPNNIHARTLRRERDGWALYFTAVNAGDFFFGNIFRATAKKTEGPWTIDPEPCFPGTMDAWFSGDRGLPQVFDSGNGAVRIFCATRTGGLILAEADKAGRYTVTGPEIPGLFHPAIAKTSWGWVLASEEKIYLSLDGRSWHRYAIDLFSRKDLETRGIVTLYITALVERDGEFRYYIEGMDESRSNVWLIQWGG